MAEVCLCHIRNLEIVYCSLHEAAPELIAALKRIVRHAEKRSSGGFYHDLADAVEAGRLEQLAHEVIRKAES